jgi:sugar transferase (PEP-CTERM system associated)
MVHIFSRYVSLRTALLACLEGCCIALAVVCGAGLRFWQDPMEFHSYIGRPDFFIQLLIVVAIFQLCFNLSNLYDCSSIRSRSSELLHLTQATGVGTIILGLLYTLYPDFLLGRGVFLISVALIALFALLSRVLLDNVWRLAIPRQRVLICGATQLGLTVAREMTRRRDLNLELAGFVSCGDLPPGADMLAGHRIYGNLTCLEGIATAQNISRIVVAVEDRRGTLPIRELVTLRVRGIYIEDAHSLISSLTGRVWLETIRPSWFVFSEGFRRSRLTLVLKRMLDLTSASIGLIVTAPLMALVAAAVKLDSKGPVIYRQERVGLRGKPFEVLKFRSMATTAEAGGVQWAQLNDARVTRLGALIRKYRLDELPQFVNILKGEMSFVGPRPERPEFLELLRREIPYYDERHSVRPGLTGWAQVEYRYGSNIEDAKHKLEYDLFYLKNLSIFFDIAIVLKTFRIVLSGSGAR